MTRRRSRAELEMEAQLRTLDPSTPRYQVLRCARDYKTAWIELGQHLTRVREKELWGEWGYATFETYCRRELKIRKDTANKLTRSFSYLRDHEPAALQVREDRELPPLDVVDLLSAAPDRSQLKAKDIQSIHEEIFDEEAAMPTKSQLLKRFRELDPNAFRRTPVEAPTGPAATRKALLLAERLAELLKTADNVSQTAVKGVNLAVQELKASLEADAAAEAEVA